MGVRFSHESPSYGSIVYRLGHQVFILRRGVRLPLDLPSHALLSLMVEVRFCSPGVVVRFYYGAPNNLSVGKSGLIRLFWEQESEGSNPSTETILWAVGIIGNTPALHVGVRGSTPRRSTKFYSEKPEQGAWA